MIRNDYIEISIAKYIGQNNGKTIPKSLSRKVPILLYFLSLSLSDRRRRGRGGGGGASGMRPSANGL